MDIARVNMRATTTIDATTMTVLSTVAGVSGGGTDGGGTDGDDGDGNGSD